MDADFGSLSDVFAAFFGETLFGQGRSAGPRPARGPDVGAQVEIDLVDAARGISLDVGVRAARSCETCAGSGAAPGTSPVTCPGCGGAGVVQQVSRTVLGQIVRSGACPRCDGAGRIVETPCERCEGDGRTLEDVPLELDVPAGIHDGQRIRVRGAGHAGTLGGPPGDVYVTVRVRPLEGVDRDGDDLHVRAAVTMTEAALGSTVSVPTPDGPLEIELAPGTQPGAVHAVRGRGMPSLETGRRGDLLVLVDVRVPTRLTAEQRAERAATRGRARHGRVPRRGRRLPRAAEERLPVSDADRRSALVVVAAEAEAVVGEWRRRYQPESVERGIPPHLTILFPFVPATEVDDDLLAELRRRYAPVRPFSYDLASVESFPDAAWLAPAPAEPFHELVGIARQAFPALPPYGDPEHVVVPHCTIGTDDDPERVRAMVRELREGLGPRLPIRCRAEEVVLVGEQANGTWMRSEAFPLQGGA